MRIQNKIALLLLLATTTILVSLAIFIYIFVGRDTTISFDQKLSDRAHALHRSMKDSVSKAEFLKTEKLPHEQSYIIRLGEDSISFAKNNWAESFRKSILEHGYAHWRQEDLFYIGEVYKGNNEDYIVVVRALDEYQREYLSSLEKILLTGLSIALLFLFSMAIIFSRKVFIPVRNIMEQVKKIGTSNMHLRLPTVKGVDELTNLTNTFNEMLDRMETAFEAQKNFVSHASHEFNTPLTTIIGEAEFALDKDRSAEQYKDALAIILTESERLRDLTFNLLRLAKAQYVNQEIQLVPIRLDELLWDIKRTQEKIYPKAKIVFPGDMLPTDEGSITVLGNVSLLHLALSNIVVNAIKYSHYEPVMVELLCYGKHIDISIKDTGVGIPDEELSKIFDPYFRASNTYNFSGFGIGLPLSANIIRMHKGEIVIESEVGKGTMVVVSLPALKR
ncbi:MAG: two-component sensor histidine kinase [Pseudopedobacter saltans]|uniref:histidine kinase n=1 Tax=Pseudopedobacter saltans TaxID=151895 RepID=A0A2W5GTC5_9SPHI|nr:MAG: two-component sensor histidine kinase [Pseudopedobacter saltans]